MKSRVVCLLTVSLVVASFFAPQIAEARGRGRASPYVMTPMGPILKSVYYGQNLQIADPATLARMRQAEQAMLNAKNKNGKNNAAIQDPRKNTAGKSTLNKKK